MNEKTHSSLLSENITEGVSTRDVAVSTTRSHIPDDAQSSSRSTSRKRHRTDRTDSRLSMSNFMKAFKSYVLCSEDDINLKCAYSKNREFYCDDNDREPMFVIVDSSFDSNPSSRELLVDQNANSDRTDNISKKRYFNKNILPNDIPSTSKGIGTEFVTSQVADSDSGDEQQVVDINLQSDHEIPLDEGENDSDSVVISYLRNKDATVDVEELSDTTVEAQIPSIPCSPRSLSIGPYSLSDQEISKLEKYARDDEQMQAVEFLHADDDFLLAAETGNDKMLRILISYGTNVHVTDHLGRNAVHLAVCSNNKTAIELLLKAGIRCDVKDDLGMTALSLCLFRRPSLDVAQMLFAHGARIIARASPMDTGLFIQFVMMCKPTSEEANILRMLISKGAVVNDANAPGGRQALHYAAMSNNCDLINLLLELGANLFLINHRKQTPKEVAIAFQCLDAAELLEKEEEHHPPRKEKHPHEN